MSGGSSLGQPEAAGSRLTKHRLAGFNHGCLVEAEKWILFTAETEQTADRLSHVRNQ